MEPESSSNGVKRKLLLVLLAVLAVRYLRRRRKSTASEPESVEAEAA
jgi:MYXO-CTERM domain-containing protein